MVTVNHPKLDDEGHVRQINQPSTPTAKDTWTDPTALALFVPGGEAPTSLNGVALGPWTDAPKAMEEWKCVDGQLGDLKEQPMQLLPGKDPAAGCVIEEPDGRVWLVKPTNGWAGYCCTYPKGGAEDGLSLQASAIKECFEEAGLKVRITGLLADVVRGQSVTRYYSAVRVGGTPTDCSWESQAVQLVPKDRLIEELKAPIDHPLAYKIGAPKLYEDIGTWKPNGQQKGSNAGGAYLDEEGVAWYCKFPHDANLARNEVLAAKLYEAAWVRVSKCKLISCDGRIGVASRIVPGLHRDKAALVAGAPGVREGFAADAWLCNWDSVGLVYDNMLLDAEGRAIRLDTGGALLYRAQGAPKGAAFGDTVGEIDSLRSPKNPQANAVFKGVTEADIVDGMKRIQKVSDKRIRELCDQFGPGDREARSALADRIIARKSELIVRFL